MNRLVIQTNLVGERHLWLISSAGQVLAEHHARHTHHAAHRLLVQIDRLIGQRTFGSLVVVRGPGPFTAIRAALVMANILGWIKNLPVTGVVRHQRLTANELKVISQSKNKKFTGPVRPWYGRQPNITVAKPSQKIRQFRKRP